MTVFQSRKSKSLLRADARERRHHAARRQETAARAAADNFLGALRPDRATVLAGYWPHRTELDCRPLLLSCLEAEIVCTLPVIDEATRLLHFHRWRANDRLRSGPFGIRQPSAASPPLTPGLILVPLLAFDRSGTRLGYGGGFYDRTIAELRRDGQVTAVGYAFAAQEMSELPRDRYDEPLDWIVTEKEAIKATGR